MATKRKRGSTWEYIVKRKALLPKPLSLTFDSEEEGDRYVARLEQLLDAGIIPPEFLPDKDTPRTISQLVERYLDAQHLAKDDYGVLKVVCDRIGGTLLTGFDYSAVESWITEMKRVHRLAPGTIRKHVGALARAIDWSVRKELLASNPLRVLPKGYSAYTPADGEPREDVQRDRRLEAHEEAAIRRVLAGATPENKERGLALKEQPALCLLFDLALETAMRMSEMHTLERGQISLVDRTIYLDKTKNGDRRQVPLSSVATAVLATYGVDGEGPLFPWRGDKDQVTSILSAQFARIHDQAGCPDLLFHDLRHEATSRFYERTQLSDIEIANITGHKDPRMLKRYANLRASKLAKKLW